MEALKHLLDLVLDPVVAGSALGVIEIVCRLFKTEKPKSLFLVVKGALEMLAALIGKVSDLLPQNIKK